MSSSVVNDFLSALFDNTATTDGNVTNSEPAKDSPADLSAQSANDPLLVKQSDTGIKRQREDEEEHKSVTEQPDSKRMAVNRAADSANTKQQQPTRKTSAPKPQYQPFQQQLLGSTGLSDPYDAYIASQKLHSMKKSSPRAKHSSPISSDGRNDSSHGRPVNQNNHVSHTHPGPKTALDKYPDEARMYIKNLPPTAAYDDISDHFSKYGKIVEVVLKSGNPFVQFESVNACRAAVDNENGKPFKSVELVLELPHKRPQHHRYESPESFSNQRNRRNDNRKPNHPGKPYAQNKQPSGQGSYTHSDKIGSHKGDWNNRQSNFHNARGQGNNNRNSNNRDDMPYRNRPHDNFDQQRQSGNNRNQRGAPERHRRPVVPPPSQPAPYRQNGSVPHGPKANFWPPQRRYGQAVPVVELIVWDKVPDAFIAYIEGRFRTSRLQLHTTYLHHNDVDKNTLMQHFVIEGVTAVIMVDRNDEVQGKVYMQVFRRSGITNNSNVHFDEYAGISVDDAVSVVTRATENSRSSPSNSMMLTQSYSQATPPQALAHTAPPVAPNLQQHLQYGYVPPQPQIPASTQPAAVPSVDYNTVATLLGMMQNVAQPIVTSDPGVNSAALQLLTSLVNNNGATTNTNTVPPPSTIPQQYDPAYSQINYNPQATSGYNAYSQPSGNQMAYTTTKPAADTDHTVKDTSTWQQNNSQYYPGYLEKSSPATITVPSSQAAPTTTNVGEILARLQVLQQQSLQK